MKRSPALTWLTSISLLVALCTGSLFGNTAGARSRQSSTQQRNTKSKTNYPTLSRYARDLTKLARQGRLAPVTGYDAEIRRVVEVLAGHTKNNPVLLGESGLARNAVADGLAQRIAAGDVPETLRNRRLFSLNLDALFAQAKNSEEITNRWNTVLAEVKTGEKEIILFIDELHGLVGSSTAQGAIASSLLQDAMAQGQVRCIGATTLSAYQENIQNDVALESFFQQVRIGDSNDDSSELSESEEKEKKDNGEHYVGAKLSSDLQGLVSNAASGKERVSVILQADDIRSGKFNALLKRHGVRVHERLQQLGALEVELPVSAVETLAASKQTSYLSLDREIHSLGHVEKTTGAEDMRKVSGNSGLDGTGIGIAILDSSIYNSHISFLGKDGNKRIRADIDFTGDGVNTNDPYGHGTHVAALAAGNNRIDSGKYTGSENNADIINLRVLNSQGAGTVSGLLKALDWLLVNHQSYKIRVVNMSLGGPAIDSYKNDPVCRAVRKLVDAGLVVVESSGNDG